MLDNLHGIGASDGAHGVELHAEPAPGEEAADGLEIEETGHEVGIIRHRVDDLHRHLAQLAGTQVVQVQIVGLKGAVTVDLLGALVDGLGHGLRGWATVSSIEFYTEILIRTAGVVASGEDDAALGAKLADGVGAGRGREDAATPDQRLGDTVGSGEPQDGLNRGTIVITAVTPHHQGAAGQLLLGVEDGLDEVLQVTGFLEHLDLFAQTGGTRTLTREGMGGDDFRLHR